MINEIHVIINIYRRKLDWTSDGVVYDFGV